MVQLVGGGFVLFCFLVVLLYYIKSILLIYID